MEKHIYTLIYRIKSYGTHSEREYSDLKKAELAETILHKFYGDDIETLIVES